ncbi:MAG: hypothetical protein ACK4PK_12045 [Alphaproteobacteria bacterium]
MFGFGKKEEVKLVGAKAKIEHAKKFGKNFQVKSKREGKEPNPTLAIVIVWGLAVGLAALLTEGVLKTGAGISTGNGGFDKLMFGPGEPALMGSSEIDYLLVLLIRGTGIFLVAGIIPGCTVLWQRLLDKNQMNVYISFWGVSIGIAVLYYLAKDILADIFKEVLAVFM